MAQRVGRGIALLFHDRGTRRVWEVSVTLRPLFTPGKDPVPIVQEAGWAPGPVWTGAENLAPNGIRSPDRPASSSVAILTELPGPCLSIWCILKWQAQKHFRSLRVLHQGVYNQVKVRCSRYRADVAQRVGTDIALLFHDRGTRRGWVVSSTPRPHFTPGKDPVPRRLGGPQGRSGRAENLVLPALDPGPSNR